MAAQKATVGLRGLGLEVYGFRIWGLGFKIGGGFRGLEFRGMSTSLERLL